MAHIHLTHLSASVFRIMAMLTLLFILLEKGMANHSKYPGLKVNIQKTKIVAHSLSALWTLGKINLIYSLLISEVMLPTRKFERLVSRSRFPWGRCLMRKGKGMALWGPVFSHLIVMHPAPPPVSLSRVNSRLSCQNSYFSEEHLRGKSTVFLFLIRWNRLTGLVSAFLRLQGERILHLTTPEMYELWRVTWP